MTAMERRDNASWVFAIGDGDNIRQRMETQLLFEDLEGCKRVSEAIAAGMKRISEFLASRQGWNIEYCGGDDILIKINSQSYDPQILRDAIKEFERCSESTISFGSAHSLQDAYLNLRRAKALGKGKLICERELIEVQPRNQNPSLSGVGCN